MLKLNLTRIGSLISARRCKREDDESVIQKFLCWLFGCCPEK
jgi:hypothetical protein